MQTLRDKHRNVAWIGSAISLACLVGGSVSGSLIWYFISTVSGVVAVGHIMALLELPDK